MVSTAILTLVPLVLIIGNPATAVNLAMETNDVADYYLSTSINFIFDIFLRHYTSKLIEDGNTQIQIGGFEQRFSTRILSLDIEGAVVVNDGWISNISTVHRTGDADLDRIGEDLVLSAHLGLDVLKIDYNEYDVSLLGEHQKGKIHVSVGTNSLWLKVNVQVKPTCLITLSDLKIEKLDDIKVDITDLGVFENLTDEITSWVVNEVTKSYKNYIEKTMFPELSKAVRDADLCHYLPI
ncbi:uncharacterized protein LOC124354231 [Homalodisca vitripennis]|uniref:uncharacterized protein LOC124354231 n=1 Tax=Homalodisca vitripennis TaxID=197043 RepID=UPI001EEB3491|nr:uncharacterized protein LOC124354231 [Homalodisca vitripennis]XP_046660493.1 uncharacterized protein LOC124354231 [Homalodisca vitripennis]